jgi:hypothetical protein
MVVSSWGDDVGGTETDGGSAQPGDCRPSRVCLSRRPRETVHDIGLFKVSSEVMNPQVRQRPSLSSPERRWAIRVFNGVVRKRHDLSYGHGTMCRVHTGRGRQAGNDRDASRIVPVCQSSLDHGSACQSPRTPHRSPGIERRFRAITLWCRRGATPGYA